MIMYVWRYWRGLEIVATQLSFPFYPAVFVEVLNDQCTSK